LKFIASELKNAAPKREGGVQKTFVISRRTLAILQEIAKAYDAPRDTLVEFSIQRLKPVIEQEKAKHDTRKRIAAKIENNLKVQRKLLEEATSLLGREDPISDELTCAVSRWENTHDAILAFLEKSEKLMAYDL
jgi:hypothetical protein